MEEFEKIEKKETKKTPKQKGSPAKKTKRSSSGFSSDEGVITSATAPPTYAYMDSTMGVQEDEVAEEIVCTNLIPLPIVICSH